MQYTTIDPDYVRLKYKLKEELKKRLIQEWGQGRITAKQMQKKAQEYLNFLKNISDKNTLLQILKEKNQEQEDPAISAGYYFLLDTHTQQQNEQRKQEILKKLQVFLTEK